MKTPLYKYQDETIWMWTYYDTCEFDYGEVDDYYQFNLNKKGSYWRKKQKIVLKNEEELKQYYPDKTKGIYIDRVTVIVEENEKSISLKIYNFSKGRKVGTTYFGTTKQVQYITYNKKYRNFYSGAVSTSKKKIRGKNVRTNNWSHIQRILSSIVNNVNEVSLSGNNAMIMDTKHGWKIFWDAIGVFNGTLGIGKVVGDVSTVVDEYFRYYYISNNFKLPNNPSKFLPISIKKSLLKKADSVVDAFMKDKGYKGKKIRKMLNSSNDVNFYGLSFFYELLGVDFFNMLSLELIHDKENNVLRENPFIHEVELSNIEKRCLVDFINDYSSKTESSDIIKVEDALVSIINDHLRFKSDLLKYDVNVKLRARTKSQFDNEHNEWVILLETYRKGKIKRKYSKMMVNEIQQPIIGPHLDYYPVLLTTTEQYNEESSHQKNCVRTYIEQSNCFIVSIREGSVHGKERATVEYKYFKGSEPLNVQSLGRFNNTLSSNWNYVLEEMNNRIKRLSELRVIELPKMKKEFPNGKIIQRQSYWNKKRLVWDNTEDVKDDIFDFFF
jgi:hypothetical protein